MAREGGLPDNLESSPGYAPAPVEVLLLLLLVVIKDYEYIAVCC